MAYISAPADFDLPQIAAIAGQAENTGFRYADGNLYVDGVTQSDLDNAISSYNHAAVMALRVQKNLTQALNRHLNTVAGERRYDDRFTCSLRAGYPGPFQQEGQVFAAWMDDCNMAAYQIMADVKQGLRPIPTEAELIEAMPVIVWPPSPVPEGAA